MSIVLRCNVFQVGDLDPGIRLSKSEICDLFNETGMIMDKLTNGAVNISIATGPAFVSIPRFHAPKVRELPATSRSVAHSPIFGALRASGDFGPLHVCYLDAFESDTDACAGCADRFKHITSGAAHFPFLYAIEYNRQTDSWPRWQPLLHEFGHILGLHHVDADKQPENLMNPHGITGWTITEKQRSRMVAAAGHIASGSRPLYALLPPRR